MYLPEQPTWDGIEAMQRALERGDASLVKLVGQRLKSMHRTSSMRAVIATSTRTEEWIEETEVRPPDAWGALHAVPIAVKDNIDTTDLGCTAGSVHLSGVPVPEDAPIVARLRAAGALIAAKTNLSEWANFRSTRSSSGWSSVHGQTINPIAPGRTPCGSSSGSASIVSSDVMHVAIGTETDGSIICPAATQGLVGFKATVGRVPGVGIVPISHSQDVAGPITKRLDDAWIVQQVLEGAVRRDEVRPLPAREPGTFTLGLYPGSTPHPGAAALLDETVAWLRDAGIEIVEIAPPDEIDAIRAAEHTVLLYEFPRDLARYLSERRPEAPFRTLADLHAANVGRAAEVLAVFGQELWDMCLGTDAPTDEQYREAQALIEAQGRGWYSQLRERGVNAVIHAANGPAWVIDHANGDRYTGGDAPPAAPAGCPALTIPMGTVPSGDIPERVPGGLPIGLAFTTDRDGDEELFAIAATVQELLARRPVRTLPDVPDVAEPLELDDLEEIEEIEELEE